MREKFLNPLSRKRVKNHSRSKDLREKENPKIGFFLRTEFSARSEILTEYQGKNVIESEKNSKL